MAGAVKKLVALQETGTIAGSDERPGRGPRRPPGRPGVPQAWSRPLPTEGRSESKSTARRPRRSRSSPFGRAGGWIRSPVAAPGDRLVVRANGTPEGEARTTARPCVLSISFNPLRVDDDYRKKSAQNIWGGLPQSKRNYETLIGRPANLVE